jgi:hypothetical protein
MIKIRVMALGFIGHKTYQLQIEVAGNWWKLGTPQPNIEDAIGMGEQFVISMQQQGIMVADSEIYI